jgi:hypothetical protein
VKSGRRARGFFVVFLGERTGAAGGAAVILGRKAALARDEALAEALWARSVELTKLGCRRPCPVRSNAGFPSGTVQALGAHTH